MNRRLKALIGTTVFGSMLAAGNNKRGENRMQKLRYLLSTLLLVTAVFASAFLSGCSGTDSSSSSTSTRFPGLERPPRLGSSATGPQTHNNAAGVYWKKKLWLFYSTEDSSNNEVHYKTFDGSSMADGGTKLNNNTDPIYSKALTNPIVVKNILYVFYTGTNGKLYYTYLDPATSVWHNTKVSDSFLTDAGARTAAVYNTLRNWVEIYWIPNDKSNDIYYSRHSVDKNGYLTGSWTGTVKILSGSASGSPHLNAVFSQTGDTTGLTYLAWVNGSRYSNISQIQFDSAGTPKILKTDTINTALASGSNDGLSLVDLGEDQMVLLNKVPNSKYIGAEYYDKKKGTWSSGAFDVGSSNNWMPTGVVNYEQAADSSAYPDYKGNKYRYDAVLYLIYGEWVNSLALSSTWKIKSFDHVGYWKPKSYTIMDTSNMMYSAFMPVLGVVDAPPYVMNGADLNADWCISGADCTKTEFEVAVTNQNVISGDVKGGAYMESGSHSPVTFELSAGLSGAYESGTAYSYTQADEIEETEESKGFIYYLAPKYVTYQLEWYGLSGTASGNYTYYVTIPDKPVVLKRFFTVAEGADGYENTAQPFIGISNHYSTSDYNRLLTYDYTGTSTDPSKYTGLFSNTQVLTWGGGSPAAPSWQVSSDTSVSKGVYIDLKIGAEFKKLFGVGVEGSFELQTTSSVKKDVTVSMRFTNPEAKVSGDVTQFDIIAYWLKADANAYWIPTDRKGMGDTPFFITYSVNKNTIGRKK